MESKLEIKFIGDTKSLELDIDSINKKLKATSEVSDGVSTSFKRIAGATIGFISVKAAITSSIGAALEFERTQRKLEVSTIDSTLAFSQIKSVVDDYGLSLRASAGSISSFAAATKGTILEGKQTMDIFRGVSAASAALGLSVDQTTGVFRALEQMVSKGTVQAEELRGQLGERLPGAFGLAAKAMGVTTQELNSMLQAGEVTAADLLPRLAKELENTFGGKAEQAANGLQGSLNKLDNVVFETANAFGEKLAPVISDFANLIKDNKSTIIGFADDIGIVSDSISALTSSTSSFTTALAGVGIIAFRSQILAIGSTLVTATGYLSAFGIEAIALVSPVAAAVAGIGALAAAIATVVYQLNQEKLASDAIVSSNNREMEANTKRLELYKKLRFELGKGNKTTKEINQSIKKLGIDSSKIFTDFSQIQKISHALAKLKSDGFDKAVESILPFRDQLKNIGIDVDNIMRSRDFKALDNAIIKVDILKNDLLSTAKTFSDKYDNIIKTKVQREQEAFDRLTSRFKEAGLLQSDEFKRAQKAHTAFIAIESSKRDIIDKKSADQAKSRALRNAESIRSFDSELKRDLISAETSFQLEKAKLEFSKSRLSNNPTISDVDARISALKSFNEKKRSIEQKDFDTRQQEAKSRFESELRRLELENGVKLEFIQAKRDEFNTLQETQKQEFIVAQESDRQNEIDRLIQFEEMKKQIKEDYLNQGVDLQREFGLIFNDIQSVNISSLSQKLIDFSKSSISMWKSGEDGKLAVTKSVTGALSGLIESRNRKMFEVGKASAIASATISTFQGAAKALEFGPIMGPVLAALVTGIGFAQIARIASTPFKGGTASKPSISRPSMPTTPIGGATATPPSVSNNNRDVNINFTVQALDPSAIDETTMQKIGDKFAPFVQRAFGSGHGFAL